ncbi:protein PAXX [Macrotis lagotis]|uniref:protein PAXX n=1 Tax=Macrotis lagotis TaxID=92651 RepID=UPI003D693D09
MQRPRAPRPLGLLPGASGSGSRYVCFCEGPEAPGGGGAFTVWVTDALELWKTCLTPESLREHKAQHGLDRTEDYSAWFRVACDQQAISLTLKDDNNAYLTMSRGSEILTFDLSKVPNPEAAPRLQALMLGLAEQVYKLERELAALKDETSSPRKKPQPSGQHLFLTDPDSRRGTSGPVTRKWIPGESLINPGFKSKKPASGVDFDDA